MTQVKGDPPGMPGDWLEITLDDMTPDRNGKTWRTRWSDLVVLVLCLVFIALVIAMFTVIASAGDTPVFLDPVNNTTLSGTVPFRVHIEDPVNMSVVTVEIKVGNEAWGSHDCIQATPSTWGVDIDTTGYADGFYLIYVRALVTNNTTSMYVYVNDSDVMILEFYNPPPTTTTTTTTWTMPTTVPITTADPVVEDLEDQIAVLEMALAIEILNNTTGWMLYNNLKDSPPPTAPPPVTVTVTVTRTVTVPVTVTVTVSGESRLVDGWNIDQWKYESERWQGLYMTSVNGSSSGNTYGADLGAIAGLIITLVIVAVIVIGIIWFLRKLGVLKFGYGQPGQQFPGYPQGSYPGAPVLQAVPTKTGANPGSQGYAVSRRKDEVPATIVNPDNNHTVKLGDTLRMEVQVNTNQDVDRVQGALGPGKWTELVRRGSIIWQGFKQVNGLQPGDEYELTFRAYLPQTRGWVHLLDTRWIKVTGDNGEAQETTEDDARAEKTGKQRPGKTTQEPTTADQEKGPGPTPIVNSPEDEHDPEMDQDELDEYEELKKGEGLQEGKKSPDAGLPFKCEICGMGFKTEKQLDAHLLHCATDEIAGVGK